MDSFLIVMLVLFFMKICFYCLSIARNDYPRQEQIDAWEDLVSLILGIILFIWTIMLLF